MEIALPQTIVFVNRDGQEIIANLPFVMELMLQWQMFEIQEEIALLQIIVFVLLPTMDLIANIQFVMDFQSNLHLLVLHMETVSPQIIVIAHLDILEAIVNFQFVMELLQMYQHLALQMSEDFVCRQTIALVIKAIVDQIAKTIFVLELIQQIKMFAQITEIVLKRIIVNANLLTMEIIVNFQISMILFKTIAKLDVL
jgi:hypothetical protein